MKPLRFETVIGARQPIAFDHGGDGGDLRGAVRVRVFRVRLQVGHPNKLDVGAVDGHTDLAFMPNPERRR